jgi:hypothetical protein
MNEIGTVDRVANRRPSGSGRRGGFFAFHADRLGPTRPTKGEIMADTSVGSQSPAAPQLVDILKALGAHRRQVYDRTYGKVDLRNNLNKIGGEFLKALEADDGNAAEGLLCRFVDAAKVECSEDSRRQMLGKLKSIMEARRAALASGDATVNAKPLDLGPEAKEAFDLRNQLANYELESDAYWQHPVLLACRWLEEHSGIKREDLEAAAFRLTTPLGLRGMADLQGPNGRVDKGMPDWLWMIPKFRELDQDGTTAKLWQKLLDECPAVLVEAGLLPATDATPPARKPDDGEGKGGADPTPAQPKNSKPPKDKRGRPADTDPKEDKRIFEAWKKRQYKTQADCDRALGLPPGATYAAVERHRKRLDRRSKRRRTK